MSSRLFSDIKRFAEYLQQKNYVIQVIILLLLIGTIARQEFIYHNLNANIAKVNKRVDFRYFNLTKSLESINKIEINTRDGRLR